MVIRLDSKHDAYGVWVKTDACTGCEIDGDYSLVFLVALWLVQEVKTARRIKTDRDAVEFIFNSYHRSR